MKVINLEGYRTRNYNKKLQGKLRQFDAYYEYCLIPDYELKYNNFKCEAVQIDDIFVNLLDTNQRIILVSIIFPNNVEVQMIIEWLHLYHISFNEKDKSGYYAGKIDEILKGVRYKGKPIILCKKGSKKIYYDESKLEEITTSYVRQHRIMNTDTMIYNNIDILENANEDCAIMGLNEKDLDELDHEMLGLDKDDCLDGSYPFSNDDQMMYDHLDDEITTGEIEVYGQNELSQCVYYFNGEKSDVYEYLVKKRALCNACEGTQNPSRIENGQFDTHHIGPWSNWHGDLNAKVMIIGQDWGDVSYLKTQCGHSNPKNNTNQNLTALPKSVGLTEEVPMFFTNAILCMKEGNGGLAAKTENDWYQNCGDRFLKRLIDLISPEIVIVLGEKAYMH